MSTLMSSSYVSQTRASTWKKETNTSCNKFTDKNSLYYTSTQRASTQTHNSFSTISSFFFLRWNSLSPAHTLTHSLSFVVVDCFPQLHTEQYNRTSRVKSNVTFFYRYLLYQAIHWYHPKKRSKKRAMCNRNHWPTVIESKATKLYNKSDRL